MSAASEHSYAQSHSTRRAQALLLCGAAAGIALAATGVLRGPAKSPGLPRVAQQAKPLESLPAGAIARVNGRLIGLVDFQQVLDLEVAKGMAIDATAKRRLLDRMIDEELRVQRAIELKLHLTDPRVRMDLSSAVADAAIAGIDREILDDATLRAYFDSRRDYFAQRGSLHVRQIWVGILAGNIGEAYNRARAAKKLLLENSTFEVVEEICGSGDPRPIPARMLRPDKLAKYLDGMALNVVLTLQAGQISDPIRTINGFRILQVLERRRLETVSFENCRLDVEAEYWSERTRRSLEANAAELRRTAVIDKTDNPR